MGYVSFQEATVGRWFSFARDVFSGSLLFFRGVVVFVLCFFYAGHHFVEGRQSLSHNDKERAEKQFTPENRPFAPKGNEKGIRTIHFQV